MDITATSKSDFATRLYHQLASVQAGENLLLSPFSIQVALAMCAVGATGETRRVIADLIGTADNVDEQNRQYSEWIRSVNGDGESPFQVATANALWGQQGYRFAPDFQKTIADFYDGSLNEVNFLALPDKSAETINAWVSEKTGGKIKDLIRRNDINQETRLILTNALYFKSKWEKEFKASDTRGEDWHGPKSTTKVPMMHQKGGYLYYEGDGFQALDIPYKGAQLSMLVVLPRNRDGLFSIENTWSAKGTYRPVTSRLRQQEAVSVSLPRFKMETKFALAAALRALGAELAFSDDADFSGISEERLKISEVVHKAFVEVNEEGTEAAAATAVIITKSLGLLPAQPKVFQADHPFLFFIRDRNTNVVLFCGRVLDPATSRSPTKMKIPGGSR